jgi:ornithine cyclodeaminase/alanine dehydrogenase-like protein (mu-crystallin family)
MEPDMIRILTGEDVRQALPMRQAIEVIKKAYARLSQGEVQAPMRTALHTPGHQGITLVMPAALGEGEQVAVKIIALFDDNPARGLPRAHALVVYLDPDTGAPAAILDGSALTALRTGAASGAATDLLARPDARSVAIFGAGVQGRAQLQAVCAVRAIREAWVYDPSPQQAQGFADEMCAALGIPVQGAHINAIGAFTPQMQEIPVETVQRAKVVVDQREAVLEEAGDLLIPLKSGVIGEDHFSTELGEVIAKDKPGRISPEQITLFKSVGVAVQDVAAAAAVFEAAQKAGLGAQVAL